jgi:hypothetical protein
MAPLKECDHLKVKEGNIQEKISRTKNEGKTRTLTIFTKMQKGV